MTATAELQALKEAHRRTWASGDYPRVAELVTHVGERIVERAGVKPGSQVLDVAAGTGNASIPAARAGAHVIATDLTPELFLAGRRRASDADVEIEWVTADAEAGWGRVEHIEELFADYPVRLSFERRAVDFEAQSPAAFIAFLADSYGPLLGARNKLSGDGRWEALRDELIALSNEMNTVDDGHFRVPSEYLVTLAGRLK